MHKIHIVKSWRRFFEQIQIGTRTHELRLNDRGYQLGDRMELNEFDQYLNAYTGRVCIVEITSMTSAQEPCAVSAEALHQDFCILSVRRIS